MEGRKHQVDEADYSMLRKERESFQKLIGLLESDENLKTLMAAAPGLMKHI